MFTLSVAANPLAEREREMYKSEFIEQIQLDSMDKFVKYLPRHLFATHTHNSEYMCKITKTRTTWWKIQATAQYNGKQ